MVKTLTVKKGGLTGVIPIQYAPEFGFNPMVKCPDYFGEYQGEQTDVIGVSECIKCKFFKGILKDKTRDYVHCLRARVKRVK